MDANLVNLVTEAIERGAEDKFDVFGYVVEYDDTVSIHDVEKILNEIFGSQEQKLLD